MSLIDVSLKSEGRVALKGVRRPRPAGRPEARRYGRVYVDRMEDKNGEAVLSREKARRRSPGRSWRRRSTTASASPRVISGKGQGGFTVDPVRAPSAFLPGSQVDIRRCATSARWLGTPQPFQILKMDRSAANIVRVAPRRPRESRAEARSQAGCDKPQGKARPSRAWSRTSTDIRRLRRIWAASTGCCTSPTSAVAPHQTDPSEALPIKAKKRSRSRSSAFKSDTPSASASA